MDGMENRGEMELVDEDFDKDEKYTEEFTSSGELRDENRFCLEFHHGFGVVSNKQENRDTSEAQG